MNNRSICILLLWLVVTCVIIKTSLAANDTIRTKELTREIKEDLLDKFDEADLLLNEEKRLLWLSTSPENIRGSHFLLPFRTIEPSSRQTSFELFLNTTGLRDEDSNEQLFKDVFNPRVFEIIDKINPLGDLEKIFRRISLEKQKLGLFSRFSTRVGNLRLKLDIPIIVSLNHLWLNQTSQQQMKDCLDDSSASSPSSTFFSQKQINTLIGLMTDNAFDIRMGDLRLALQWIPFCAANIEPYVGLEVFLPLIRPSFFDKPLTDLTYPQEEVGLIHFINSDAVTNTTTGSDLDEFAFANKNKIYKFLFNTLTVLRKTKLSAQGDSLKAGGGIFFGAKMSVFDDKFDLFARIRFDYLAGGTRHRIIPVEQMLIPCEFKGSISPVSIIQCTGGTKYNLKNWNLGGGYDFYLKTREDLHDLEASEEALRTMKKDRAEIPKLIQHKLFGEISYTGARSILSAGGDYTIYSQGTIREWSLGFSVATKF